MSKVFWFVLSSLIALAVHISYVLFVPAMQFQSRINDLVPNDGKSQWRVIADSERYNLLPGFSGSGLAAACPLDVSKGTMELELNVPKDYWVLSIYSQSGKQVYALNDKQAGAETFSIVVSRTKSIVDQVFNAAEPEDKVASITNAAWNVSLPDRRGVAVLWIPTGSDGMRSAHTKLVEKSVCKRAQTPATTTAG
jgi:uncharacterized membrane protein